MNEHAWLSFAEAAAPVVARCAIGAMMRAHVESPIEQIFGAAVLFLHPDVVLCTDAAIAPDRVALVPQYRWCGFRIDWAICAPGQPPAVFVECDGAEFHSAPPDVARDRRKDAAAREAGIEILRFTGSEIYRNYDACARIAMAHVRRAA